MSSSEPAADEGETGTRGPGPIFASSAVQLVGLAASVGQIVDFIQSGKISTVFATVVIVTLLVTMGLVILYRRHASQDQASSSRLADIVMYSCLALATISVVTIASLAIVAASAPPASTETATPDRRPRTR